LSTKIENRSRVEVRGKGSAINMESIVKITMCKNEIKENGKLMVSQSHGTYSIEVIYLQQSRSQA